MVKSLAITTETVQKTVADIELIRPGIVDKATTSTLEIKP
jgi:hypothetical protein